MPKTNKDQLFKLRQEKDRYIEWNIKQGNLIVDASAGKVYATRGPGGVPYDSPRELKGTVINGYHVVNIRNMDVKLQCRVHRIVWISQNGLIPYGYTIDHINSDKSDNRIENLQVMTHEENAKKARDEGRCHPTCKLDPRLRPAIKYVYEHAGVRIRDIAKMYGISVSRVGQILHNERLKGAVG